MIYVDSCFVVTHNWPKRAKNRNIAIAVPTATRTKTGGSSAWSVSVFFEGICLLIITYGLVSGLRKSPTRWVRVHDVHYLWWLTFFWNAEFFAARNSQTETEEEMSGMGTLPWDARGLWKRPGQPTGVYTEIGGKIGRIRIYCAFNCHSYGVPCCPEPLHPLRRQTLRVRGFLPSSTILVPIQKSHSLNY